MVAVNFGFIPLSIHPTQTVPVATDTAHSSTNRTITARVSFNISLLSPFHLQILWSLKWTRSPLVLILITPSELSSTCTRPTGLTLE